MLFADRIFQATTWTISVTMYSLFLFSAENSQAATHSAESPVFTLDTRTFPAVPTGLQASRGKYIYKVWLTWNPVDSATNYIIYRATTADSATAEQIAQGTSASYADTRGLAGTEYYYWVKAVNPSGAGPFSDSASGYRRRASGMTAGGSGDYDGDGIADIVTYNAATGTWTARLSGSGYAPITITGWGGPDYIPVPADYDGDGKMDPAVYNENTGVWKAWQSSQGYVLVQTPACWGGPGYLPVPADYDGDDKADPAVYHEASGTWWAWMSGAGYAKTVAPGFGGPGYIPAPADYDGDGKADPGVFSTDDGRWKAWMSGTGYAKIEIAGWGTGGIPIPMDYDGDGKDDPAAYDESTGMWTVWPSSHGYQPVQIPLGGWGFAPVPADYDGDGKVDFAVYNEVTGEWRARLSLSGYVEQSVRW